MTIFLLIKVVTHNKYNNLNVNVFDKISGHLLSSNQHDTNLWQDHFYFIVIHDLHSLCI